jgi:hypothetical protein
MIPMGILTSSGSGVIVDICCQPGPQGRVWGADTTRGKGSTPMLRNSLIGYALFTAVLLLAPPAESQGFEHDFRICVGDFALCAASTCTALQGITIAVNTANGTANFPAAECTCPIFNGPALADLNGGNMQGSCDPPPNNGVWSLYLPTGQIPQEINDWIPGKKQSAAPIQVCGSGNFANCFSFACTGAEKVKGDLEVATCICPINESLEGTDAGPPFVTPAGQCNQAVCSGVPGIPVGAPFPFDDIQPGQCLRF